MPTLPSPARAQLPLSACPPVGDLQSHVIVMQSPHVTSGLCLGVVRPLGLPKCGTCTRHRKIMQRCVTVLTWPAQPRRSLPPTETADCALCPRLCLFQSVLSLESHSKPPSQTGCFHSGRSLSHQSNASLWRLLLTHFLCELLSDPSEVILWTGCLPLGPALSLGTGLGWNLWAV